MGHDFFVETEYFEKLVQKNNNSNFKSNAGVGSAVISTSFLQISIIRTLFTLWTELIKFWYFNQISF